MTGVKRLVVICAVFLGSAALWARVSAASTVSCGGVGQECCDDEGEPCVQGAVCQGGQCVACGGVNQPCCEEGECNEGLVCQGFFERSIATGGGAGDLLPTCVSCGALGEPCCPDGNGGSCDSPFLLCDGSSDLCEACGGVGQQCCSTPNPCPLSGGQCAGGICEAGPLSVPALRGAGIAALTLALLSVAMVTFRRWSRPA